MKRKTAQIKKYELFACLSDIAFVIFLLATVIHCFIILQAPQVRTEVINVPHSFFNAITLYSSTINSLITVILVYLVIYVPMTSINVKNLISKEIIELDKWSYRTQTVYGFVALVPLIGFLALTISNPGFIGYFLIILIIACSAIYFRFKSTYSMKKIVLGYGFKQTIINFKEKFLNLFKKEYWNSFKDNIKERKQGKVTQSNEQQNLDKTIAKDLILKIIRIVVTYTFLTIFALFIFIPFYWMIVTSLKSHEELTTRMVPRFFISLKEMHWENYKIVFGPTYSFGKYILNTVYVGVITMLCTVVTTILAAFAFSRLKFPGRDLIFLVLLGTMMIPGELYTITNYLTVSKFNWMNSFYALIIPFSTSVFYIFFLRQSFLQIPESLYQSAKVDGCSDIKYLTRVMLPIAQPTLITIIILSTIGAWDAYIWPRLVTSKDHWLISVALRSTSFTTGEGSDARPMYNLQLAATAIVTIPLMIIFFAFKKYIIKGVGRSGTKG